MTVVFCTGNTCSVTIGGTGSVVHVLGTSFSLEAIANGQATLRVGDETVSCTRGQEVSSTGVRLTCTEVETDTVTFTATVD